MTGGGVVSHRFLSQGVTQVSFSIGYTGFFLRGLYRFLCHGVIQVSLSGGHTGFFLRGHKGFFFRGHTGFFLRGHTGFFLRGSYRFLSQGVMQVSFDQGAYRFLSQGSQCHGNWGVYRCADRQMDTDYLSHTSLLHEQGVTQQVISSAISTPSWWKMQKKVSFG